MVTLLCIRILMLSMSKLSKIPVFVFLSLGLFLMSFFWWSKAPVPFEVPKAMFFQIFTWILILLLGISVLLKRKVWKIDFKLFLPVIVFVIWATFTSVIGRDDLKSFVGNYYRNDGLITFYELILFAVAVSYFWREKYKKIISLSFFASSSLLSLLTLFELLTHNFGLGLAATFGNPVLLAGYLVCSLPFAYFFIHSTNLPKVWKILLYVLPVFAIILTNVLGATSVMVVYLGFEIARKFGKKLRLVLVLFGLAISFAIIGYWYKGLAKEKYLNPQGRDRVYHKVLVGALMKPFTGWGWANVDYAFESNNWPIKINYDVYVDKAHSEILEVLATTGIPGLVIYLYFLSTFFITLIRRYKKSGDKLWSVTLISVFCLYLFHSQTNVISISEEVIFWLILGITISTSNLKEA